MSGAMGLMLISRGGLRSEVAGDVFLTSQTNGASFFLPNGQAAFAYGVGSDGYDTLDAQAARLLSIVEGGADIGDASSSLAFITPTGILQQDGQTVGFVSDRGTNIVDPTLLEYIDVPRNQLADENLSLPSRVYTARLLAGAFSAVHDAGSVIGCLDPTRVRLSFAVNRITFENAWAFGLSQIKGGAKRKPLAVLPMYRPREMLDVPSVPERWGVEQDLFLLAVVTFQLITGGRHPFAPIAGWEAEWGDIESRIRRGLYWPREKGADWLTEGLRRLFELGLASERARNRPGAAEWVKALTLPTDRSSYDRCLKVKDRQHGRWATFAGHSCPLCDPLPSVSAPMPQERRQSAPPEPSPGELPTSLDLRADDSRPVTPAPVFLPKPWQSSGHVLGKGLAAGAATVVLLGMALFVWRSCGPSSDGEIATAAPGASATAASTAARAQAPSPGTKAPAEKPSAPQLSAASAVPPMILPSWPENPFSPGRGLATMRVELNQLYAVRGMRFDKSVDLHLFFSRFDWYRPTGAAASLDKAANAKAKDLRANMTSRQAGIAQRLHQLDKGTATVGDASLPPAYIEAVDLMLREGLQPHSDAFINAWLWLKGNEPTDGPGTGQQDQVTRLESISEAKTIEDRAAAGIVYANLVEAVRNSPPKWSSLSELALAGNKLGIADKEVLYWARRGLVARPSHGGSWIAFGVARARTDMAQARAAFCVALRVTNNATDTREKIEGHARDDFGQGAQVAEAARAGLAECKYIPVRF